MEQECVQLCQALPNGLPMRLGRFPSSPAAMNPPAALHTLAFESTTHYYLNSYILYWSKADSQRHVSFSAVRLFFLV